MKGLRDKAEKEKFLRSEVQRVWPELEQAKVELERIMKSAAHAAGAKNVKFKARIKPEKSIVDKVINRGKGFEGLADLVGGMILVDTQEEVDEIVKHFRKKLAGSVIEIEKKEKSGDDVFGYYGSSHIDLKLPGTGVVAELQLMTKKLERYKKPAHDIYTKYRSAGDVRKAITPEEGHQSRMLFHKGNQSRNLREWLEDLLEAAFGGGYQRGGTLGQARDSARDERKLSKSEEIELAEQSPIFRKHMSPNGWKFVTTVHAAARAFQRRLEFEFSQWKEIHDRVASRVAGFDRWKKGDNFVLFYSKSYQQGYVTNVFPETKTIRIITVLPKGKNLAPAGTAKVLVENYQATEDLELMELTIEDVEFLLNEGLEEARKKPVAPAGLPSAVRMDAMRLAQQDVREKKPKRTIDDKWIKPYGSNAAKFHAVYSDNYDSTASFHGLNEATGKELPAAPEGMTLYNRSGNVVPKIGDWLAYSIHYTMLSGAHAYQITGFSGKSTIIAQEYQMVDQGNDATRVLVLDPSKKIGAPVKLRVGRGGDVKAGFRSYMQFHSKEEVASKGIKFTGSRYD